MNKTALISVYNKDGILDLAHFLLDTQWKILSTGGTASFLTENGIPVTDVSSVTGFPECLDGRVKTLHPSVHAGLLARRNDTAHMAKIAELNIKPIDLICVNLYPFFEKVQANLSFSETVEFIDIGGPAMLRSAAKNFEDVLVLTDPSDYANIIECLKGGSIPHSTRRHLAAKVFNLTSAYDAAVFRFMLDDNDQDGATLQNYYTMPLIKAQNLRYGENAHQKAALYVTADRKGAFGGMTQLQGKELSYNNMRDLDVAWKAVCAFTHYSADKNQSNNTATDTNFVVALKHNTPCGAAVDSSIFDAYTRTYNCDPLSIFGGIIGCSHIVDAKAAHEMNKCFLEVIVAPDFTDEAKEIFATTKKNLRLITATVSADEAFESMSVDGGILVQSCDRGLFEKWDIVTKAQPSPTHAKEAVFGMTIAMFAKSNAIVVVNQGAAIGIGCGQTNRIWATEQALERAKIRAHDQGMPTAELLISDAFFPFADCVEKAAEYGIKTIIQPGGSIRDQESIDTANKRGIAMVFTGTRHFKH